MFPNISGKCIGTLPQSNRIGIIEIMLVKYVYRFTYKTIELSYVDIINPLMPGGNKKATHT